MNRGIKATTHRGIQALLAPRSGSQVAAGLLFRVGRADETLSTSGITHLVEHLALYAHGATDLHFNGSTDATFTHFHVEGSTEEAVRFLNGVSAALRDLPMNRLEIEKQILRVESNTRGVGPVPDHAMVRYGAQGFGLTSYDELGLGNATADLVRAWTARWFSRQNAALWFTGSELPDDLALDLGQGEHIPPPAASTVLGDTPAWYQGGGTLTFLDASVPRSTAASLFAAVLGSRMLRELRQEGGLCYTASADYAPYDRSLARISAVADAHPSQLEAVAGGLVDSLAGLRFGTIDQAELDAARTTALRMLEEADVDAKRLPGAAANVLLGYPNLSIEELADELQATSVEDLREVAEQVWSDALIRTPAGDLTWAGAVEAPRSSLAVVEGTEYPSRQNDGSAIVVGRDGVSLDHPNGRATVHYRDAVAALRWPDGARMLIGADGFTVRIEPTMYPLTPADIASIDASVEPGLTVTMPERDPEDIPHPPPVTPDAMPLRRIGRAERAGVNVLSVVLFLISAIILGAAAVMELQPQTRGQDTGNTIGAVAFGLVSLATAIWLARRGRLE